MNRNEKKAVFLDIDGTLLTDSYNPPKENIEMINAVREMGHKVFINTGRSWANIPPELMKHIEHLDGIIAGNGSYIVLDGKLIFAEFFSRELLKRLCDYFLSDPERSCLFEGCDGLFCIPDSEGRFLNDAEFEITGVNDFSTKFTDRHISVVAYGGTVSADFIEKFGNEIATFQFRTFADCVPIGCNKARGMDIMLEAVGIPLENSIAIGDSMNDYPMLEHAAVGIAMGNSADRLKELADDVTETNVNCGVALSLKKYLM